MRALCKACPGLKSFIRPNPKGDATIDFNDPRAVLFLNKALLAHYYRIKSWDLPEGYLCPPIPGRADYIHHLADFFAKNYSKKNPPGTKLKVLDIGTGANCIYPIIGTQAYDWDFVATDIDPVAIESARSIVQANPCLKNRVHLILQQDKLDFFESVVTDRFDITLCNPPFYASMAEAQANNRRKRESIHKNKKTMSPNKFNFGGQETELCCKGGELAFIKRMAKQSVLFADKISLFTCLVSNSDHIKVIKKRLVRLGAKKIETIEMSQGQKISRFIAWSFNHC
jgi:23S rRNA (adenine1618-N6)-methyltransferase